MYNIGTAALGSGENPFIIPIVSATHLGHLQTVQYVTVFFSYLYVIQFQPICYRYFEQYLYYDEVQFTHEKTNHGAITDAVPHAAPSKPVQSHSLLMALSLTPWRKARTRSKSNWMGDSMAGE